MRGTSPVGSLRTANPTAQEALAYPLRQGTPATVTVPGYRNDRRRRFGRQLTSRGGGWGTLMRHFLLLGSVTALAFGMGMTTTQTGLIPATRSTHRPAAGAAATLRRAVAMAAITVATDEHSRAASCAQVASSWKLHWQSGPMGNRRRCPLREILCRQRRRCWAAGRGIGSGLAVGTGVAPAFPPANLVFTALASTAPPPVNQGAPSGNIPPPVAPPPCRTSLARRRITTQSLRR